MECWPFCFEEISLFPLISVLTWSPLHASGLYYYEGFGVFAIPFVDAKLALYKAAHLGDIQEDIIAHLAMTGKTVPATIKLIA